MGYLPLEKMKKPLKIKGFHGGRNRTRTCDSIDVNDVLSAPATFVQEEDEFPIRLQSRSHKGFHGICTRVRLHP